jgi:predicted NBD/HSP70 family sugar kinase
VVSAERFESLAAVLHAIRTTAGVTQPLLTTQAGLGRNVVAQRVAELEAIGLVASDGMAPSTGGRAPRQLRLRAEAGVVVGLDIGATGMSVGVADLSGHLLEHVQGPVEELIDELLARVAPQADVWGIGVGVPGPVEFETGLPVAPPIMPGWDGYPIRERLSRRYSAPTWVDNDANLLAIAEMRANPAAVPGDDLLYVKIGMGIGAGLVSRGRVAVTEAENIICRCGNVGCLEAIAGGGALAREGRRLAEIGGSPVMAELLEARGELTAAEVTEAADRGDPAARAILARAGRTVGATLATLVSFYNPRRVILGGGVVAAGDYVLAAIRESVYRRSLPLATRTLRLEYSQLGEEAELLGAVHLVLDELFTAERLPLWLPHGTPAGRPEVVALPTVSVIG